MTGEIARILYPTPNLIVSISVWQFYGIQLQRIATTRAALLLRLLVVDTKPLEAIIAEARQNSSPQEIRFGVFRANIDSHC
jgi:hypothetical protein